MGGDREGEGLDPVCYMLLLFIIVANSKSVHREILSCQRKIDISLYLVVFH